MSRRTDQRREAIFLLYRSFVTPQDSDNIFKENEKPFIAALLQSAVEHAKEFDKLIDQHAVDWTSDRIALLERAILHVAFVEILYSDTIPAQRPIPKEGAIDEAVEIAKIYCAANAPAFINGVLAAVLREQK